MKPSAKPVPRSAMLLSYLATLSRTLLAALLMALLSPILAPALFLRLPPCAPFHLLDRLAVHLLTLVAALAGISASLHPRTPLPGPSWLPPPLVRRWESALPHRAGAIVTYDQPGRWLPPADLAALHASLRTVAHASIGCVPSHALFGRDAAAALAARVVSVAHDRAGRPVAFSALAYLDVAAARDGHAHNVVVHLGLTMVAADAKGRRLQAALFMRALLAPVASLRTMRYTVTNVAASPAGIGNVCDYFLDCFPHYGGEVARTKRHVDVAREVLGRHRKEFGCSERARFDAASFVVFGSNEEEGGGTHEFIRGDGSAVSRHREKRCNEFVRDRIDIAKGDEIFQVATADVIRMAFGYIVHAVKRKVAL